ncbi:unnamed protein product [Rotaria sp. Silwood1]|nr:unnamed protein product [Rotaria sp. Silwood1]
MSSSSFISSLSLYEENIESLVKLCLSKNRDRVDMHGGRKAALQYLLHIQSAGFDLSSFINLKDFEKLKEEINKLKELDFYKKKFDEHRDDTYEQYWELTSHSNRIHPIAKNARQIINKYGHFPLEQLKVYFNAKQIDNIPSSKEHFESCGSFDDDARDNMLKYPIAQRQNKGQINTKQGRIEKAIFDVPSGKQIIVLDFADERMPGGLFLYGASTQEETICYNSNAYGALLDFKYQCFDGGFMIPEFGCLYIKNVKFFKPTQHIEERTVDIVAAACYDLTREHGLYEAPSSFERIEANTQKKLETVIASAQANTEENGSDTYLIIGPIGCGAFQNPIQTIVKLWAKILSQPLNNSLNTQKRHAFEHIWFLSGKTDKLITFEKACAEAFGCDIVQRL